MGGEGEGGHAQVDLEGVEGGAGGHEGVQGRHPGLRATAAVLERPEMNYENACFTLFAPIGQRLSIYAFQAPAKSCVAFKTKSSKSFVSSKTKKS